MNLPMDVFFEIASHLHPLDLLHIARTNKYLRSVLLHRSSRFVWKASLNGVAGLPTCPEDMDEPAYSGLLFEPHCSVCGSHARRVEYAIRVRLCKHCYAANMKTGHDFFKELAVDEKSDFLKELAVDEERKLLCMAVTPCEIGRSVSITSECIHRAIQLEDPLEHELDDKYYVPQLFMSFTGLFRNPDEGEALQDWAEDVCAHTIRLHEQATAILLWKKDTEQRKAEEDQALALVWKASILEKLDDMDYVQADFPDSTEWRALIEQPKVLTNRVWTNLRPKLEDLLQQERRRRAQVAFEKRRWMRIQQIGAFYEFFVVDMPGVDRRLMPNVYDAGQLPSLLELAERNNAQGDVGLSEFLGVLANACAETDVYLSRAKEIAVERLAEGGRDWHYDVEHEPRAAEREQCNAELQTLSPDETLTRYYAIYSCRGYRGCNIRALTFEEIHAHWRTTHPYVAWGSPHEPQLNKRSGDAGLRSGSLENDGSYGGGGMILDAVGLPRDTPISTLDELVQSGRLYCACGDPSLPPPGALNWAKLFAHIAERREKYRDQEQQLVFSPKSMLRSDHVITGSESCVKLLPPGVDTSAAAARVTVDDKAQLLTILERLASRPTPQAVPVCRMCKRVAKNSYRNRSYGLRKMALPDTPEGIVWHLRGWHAKEFQKIDILWETLYA
ncbi:hypothetical protein BD413DRAFT_314671 [Trametes elegans]|nr:hypothetical protein BD413DRAFT_314671 [Trametes elegans]